MNMKYVLSADKACGTEDVKILTANTTGIRRMKTMRKIDGSSDVAKHTV